MTNIYHVVGKPIYEQIPIIVEAEKAEADADQIAIAQQSHERRPTQRNSFLSRCRRQTQLARGRYQPWNQPKQRRETDDGESGSPAILGNHERDNEAFQ